MNMPEQYAPKGTLREEELPIMIGAEVFIEPGQRAEDVDTWFKALRDCNMTVTRIRMFETYMRQEDGSWDFSLFDRAFEAADRYGIKVYANLFPATSFDDVGGFKFPSSRVHMESIAAYIEAVVSHFSIFDSLYGWVPINEPGGGRLDGELARELFVTWKQGAGKRPADASGYPHFDFADERFLLYYNTWFLEWLVDEIRKHDVNRPIHVNNHNIFELVAEYDFPSWRPLLSSLGGSAHASWHFKYFERREYALAIAANSELLRSGAGPIPWMMTELQGGNNTYSAFEPLCPTPQEIEQWLWITLGAGSKGSIFWCLNARASGFEAGEWAMLNYQNEPSDRMLAAAECAGIIGAHSELFSKAEVADSGVNLIYTRESLWIEDRLQVEASSFYHGRAKGGSMKSVLAFYEALCNRGVQANIKEIGEFDFDQDDFVGVSIIFAHQISIPEVYFEKLENFARKGGRLVFEGLSGYYNEVAICQFQTGFPLSRLMGASIKEVKLIADLFTTAFNDTDLFVPSHLWRGTLLTDTAIPLAWDEHGVYASVNKFGAGEVIWLPSLLALGSRIKKDYSALERLLDLWLFPEGTKDFVCFSSCCEHVILRTLNSAGGWILILINKGERTACVSLSVPPEMKTAETKILFGSRYGHLNGKEVQLMPEGTMVLYVKPAC